MDNLDSTSRFIAWFRDLGSSQRINTICGIFSSCNPMELRFFATCIGDLFVLKNNQLEDAEAEANVYTIIRNFDSFEDAITRCRLIMAVCLLRQTNYECSKAIYNVLFQYMQVGWIKDDTLFTEGSTADQIELLLTLISNHPAFTFTQKSYITEQMEYLQRKRKEYLVKQEQMRKNENKEMGCIRESRMDAVNGYLPQDNEFSASTLINKPDISRTTPDCVEYSRTHEGGRIQKIQVAGAYLKRIYKIDVTFPSGKKSKIEKSAKDIANYHYWLSGYCEPKICLPELPDLEVDVTSSTAALNQILNLQDYFRKFLNLVPNHVIQDSSVVAFFQSTSGTHSTKNLADQPIVSRVKACPGYECTFKHIKDEKTTKCDTPARCGEFPESTPFKAVPSTLQRRTRLTFYPPISSSSSSEDAIRKPTLSESSISSTVITTESGEQCESGNLQRDSPETNENKLVSTPSIPNEMSETEQQIKNLRLCNSDRPRSRKKSKKYYKKIYPRF